MKAISNIFTFNHQDLVSFLQKIGQFEAARIVKKHDIDGKFLLAFSDQEVSAELTDYEKKTLLSVINCTKVTLGSLSKSKLALTEEDCETNTHTESQDYNLAGDLLLDNVKETDEGHLFENSFINTINVADDSLNTNENRTSSKYYTFHLNPIARRKETKVHVYPANHEYLEPIEVSSSNYRRSSSSYISPVTHLPSRYNQITTDRIKMYLPKDYDLKVGHRTNQNNSYIEVLDPAESRSRSEKDNTKKGPNSVCDFVLYLCGFSCFLGCKKK
ncbi:uncharacterized protein [Diabrotica undecimpunctata]|uniref:uncharacterized protein isoform X2 n=1 Tax=Diabrotica undecimpunctata TaxID=50387 RepID=UPI003B642536